MPVPHDGLGVPEVVATGVLPPHVALGVVGIGVPVPHVGLGVPGVVATGVLLPHVATGVVATRVAGWIFLGGMCPFSGGRAPYGWGWTEPEVAGMAGVSAGVLDEDDGVTGALIEVDAGAWGALFDQVGGVTDSSVDEVGVAGVLLDQVEVEGVTGVLPGEVVAGWLLEVTGAGL